MDIRALIKEEVLSQTAYPVETTPCRIKLDANENPLAIPPRLRERFAALLASIDLNRYPEAGSVALASRFAAAFGVEADQVIIGNGSDELIQILCAALARPGAEVMIPVPTFAMYRISALNSGLRVAAVPLDKEFDLDLPEDNSSVERDEPFGRIESAKAAVELISPVSGTVISVNEDITDDIGIINSDPHDAGWMIVVEMEDPEELDGLLDTGEYQEFVTREEEIG